MRVFSGRVRSFFANIPITGGPAGSKANQAGLFRSGLLLGANQKRRKIIWWMLFFVLLGVIFLISECHHPQKKWGKAEFLGAV
jgi:hypothetical protein